MNLFRKLFGKSEKEDTKPELKKTNINDLLSAENINDSIIKVDEYISELCSWGDDIDKLSTVQKNFWYNQNLEREINNGGFNQYFFNSSGDFAHETIHSLNEIKAFKTVDILKEAMALFPGGEVPADRRKRQELLVDIQDNAEQKWNELDQAFYCYEDDLNNLNMEYLRENKDKF